MLKRLLRLIVGIIAFFTSPILYVLHGISWVLFGFGFLNGLTEWILSGEWDND